MISELIDAQKQLLNKAELYQESVNQIKSILNQLQNQWEGDAQAAFQTEQAQAIIFYNQMANRIAACAKGYGYAAKQYSKADKTSADIIKSVNA